MPTRRSEASARAQWRVPLAVLAAGLIAGCATMGPSPGEPRRGPDAEDRQPPAGAEPRPSPSSRLLDRAEELLDRGRAERAYRLADSLYLRFRAAGAKDEAARSLGVAAAAALALGDTVRSAELSDTFLREFPDAGDAPRAALRLAELRMALGDDPGAVRVLLVHAEDWKGLAGTQLREAAGHLSVSELEVSLDQHGASAPDSAASVLRSELARARRAAEDRRAVRIGFLAPMSGRLAPVGAWLREGIELAIAAAPDAAPDVELVPVDLAEPGSVRHKVERLLADDVVALIGPIDSDDLAAASSAARGILVVSPTAREGFRRLRPVYALWDRRRREVDASTILGKWLGEALGPVETAVLYPETELGRRAHAAFARAFGESGGRIAVAVSFEPGGATFEAPIRRLSAHRPRVIFVPTAGSIIQLAPQLPYYGLRGSVVAGGPDWSAPSTVRRLEPSVSQRRIVATYLDWTDGGGWQDFSTRYERRYRKALGDNVLPGLGHDAALLLLRALVETRPARPAAVARRFAALREVSGATGVMTPDPETGTVGRTVRVLEIAGRRLRETAPSDVRRWLERVVARAAASQPSPAGGGDR